MTMIQIINRLASENVNRSIFRLYACQCAIEVAHLWDIPGVVNAYLLTGRSDLREEAASKANEAAKAAKDAATKDAAISAAWACADIADWIAARAGAKAASRALAWAADNATIDPEQRDINWCIAYIEAINRFDQELTRIITYEATNEGGNEK